MDDIHSLLQSSVQTNRPCLLPGLVKSWPALTRWQGKAGKQYLKQVAGNAHVLAMYSENDLFYGNIARHVPVACVLGELLDKSADQEQSGSDARQHMYLAQQSLEGPLEALWADIDVPICLQGVDVTETNLWLSSGTTRSSLHYDQYQNLLCVVTGRKEVTLYSPEVTPGLYPHEVYGESPNHSKVAFHDPDHQLHPNFRYAKAKSCRVTLDAGDSLFIPEGWWHQVNSLDCSPGCTIAINFWWQSQASQLLLSCPHMHLYFIRRLLGAQVAKDRQLLISTLEGDMVEEVRGRVAGEDETEVELKVTKKDSASLQVVGHNDEISKRSGKRQRMKEEPKGAECLRSEGGRPSSQGPDHRPVKAHITEGCRPDLWEVGDDEGAEVGIVGAVSKLRRIASSASMKIKEEPAGEVNGTAEREKLRVEDPGGGDGRGRPAYGLDGAFRVDPERLVALVLANLKKCDVGHLSHVRVPDGPEVEQEVPGQGTPWVDEVAETLGRLSPVEVTNVLYVMSRQYPQEMRWLWSRGLTPLGAEVVTRKLELADDFMENLTRPQVEGRNGGHEREEGPGSKGEEDVPAGSRAPTMKLQDPPHSTKTAFYRDKAEFYSSVYGVVDEPQQLFADLMRLKEALAAAIFWGCAQACGLPPTPPLLGM